MLAKPLLEHALPSFSALAWHERLFHVCLVLEATAMTVSLVRVMVTAVRLPIPKKKYYTPGPVPPPQTVSVTDAPTFVPILTQSPSTGRGPLAFSRALLSRASAGVFLVSVVNKVVSLALGLVVLSQ